MAFTDAWVRSETPSFFMIRWTWVLTVERLTMSSFAIWRLVFPEAMRRSASVSRPERMPERAPGTRPGARTSPPGCSRRRRPVPRPGYSETRAISLMASSWLSAFSPARTLRTALSSWGFEASFKT